MAGKSNIEWTERTWNPIVGCSIVSPGCINCYAMRMAARLESVIGDGKHLVGHYAGTTKRANGNAVWTGKLAQAPEKTLLEPLRRKKPTTYFVNSMGDLFHKDAPDEWIDRVFAVMALCPQHTFQVLTKRAERMRQWFAVDRADSVGLAMLTLVDRIPHGHRRVPWPLPNVWLGVSAERQQEADERIPLLLQTPAAIRFVSAEPLLGPIDLKFSYRPGIHWIIVGGESGPGARPMHPDWTRSIRDQCAAAGVAFFFKQHGEHVAGRIVPDFSFDGDARVDVDGYGQTAITRAIRLDDQYAAVHVGKKRAGRLLDGREHNAMPCNLSSALAGTQNKTNEAHP